MPRHTARYRLPQGGAPVLPVLPDMTRQNAVNAGIGLRIQASQLQDQAREAQIARSQSSDAKAQYQLQKEIETDRQKAAFYNGLQELESNLNAQGHKIGSQGHAEAFAAYAHEFPLARSASDVQQTLKLHSQIADDQAALKQRMNAMNPPPEKIAQRYAKVQGDISTFSATPGKEADLNGALVESDQIEKAYPQLKVPTLPQQTVYPDGGTPTPAPPSVQVAPGYGTPAAPTAAPTVAPVVDHTAAMDWANANPNDPRAQVIIQRAQAAIPQSTPETTPQPDEGQ